MFFMFLTLDILYINIYIEMSLIIIFIYSPLLLIKLNFPNLK